PSSTHEAHYAGSVPAETTAEAVTAAWRAESARLVGALTRMTRDVQLAEDLAQDAMLAALEQWPTAGVPTNPAPWLTPTPHLPRQEDAHRGQGDVRAPDRPGSDQAPRRRHGGDLPDLQRGLLSDRRRGLDASRPGERGDAPGPDAGGARARGARGLGTSGAP